MRRNNERDHVPTNM